MSPITRTSAAPTSRPLAPRSPRSRLLLRQAARRRASPAATADDGAYFVDRDATHFRYILNFLRDGQVDVLRSLPLHHEPLREARFYQLGGLQRQLEAAIAELGGGPAAAPATRVLHVPPSMGSVTNYALSWDANVKTIQQCHLEAQRETDEMVEFVQLSNDSALTFPVAEAGKKEKTAPSGSTQGCRSGAASASSRRRATASPTSSRHPTAASSL